jgi:hypothetical protein
MSVPAEQTLEGGNVGRVVRVGDTVRRTAGPWTPAVHELLRYLDYAGFDYSPRPLGFDEQGREIVSYIAGETVGTAHPWPEWAWSDATLEQAGRLLRHYHDTVTDFRPEGSRVWRFVTDHLDAGEVICHNDFAPYNMVWNDGVIVGIIDWDLASPADPISDLAFTAWSFCPIHQPSDAARLGAPTDIVRRLKLLCGSYGLERSEKLLEAIRKRMRASIDGIQAKAATGDAAFQGLIAGGHVGRMERDAQWLDLHRQKWEEKLGAP